MSSKTNERPFVAAANRRLNQVNNGKREKWYRLMTLLKSVSTDKALVNSKGERRSKRLYVFNLIDIYESIHKNEQFNNFKHINTDKINNFIKLLTTIIKDQVLVGELNKCIFPDTSREITGKIIAIRHSETYENIFHHHAKTSGVVEFIKGHVELATKSHYRNSPVTCVGHLMIKSSQEQLMRNEELQEFIRENFPLVIRSEKKRTHTTGNGILDPIEHYNPLKFNLYMFNEKDPQTLIKMTEYYRLARMMIACIPVNNLVIIGHSGWFRDFFNQKKDLRMAGVINPVDKKMFNAQGLLYNYKLRTSMDIVSTGGWNILKNVLLFSYDKRLFQPNMEAIENNAEYNQCLEENQRHIATANSRRNIHISNNQ
jgi:hypothetical protein